MTITTKAILKELDCKCLTLVRVKGHAYHIFVYDDPKQNIYETASVYVPFLNHLSFEEWLNDGRIFLNDLQEKHGDRVQT